MSSKVEDVWDVIIIGAGVAGLSAARELEKSKINYLLLEARSKAGGRARTIRRPNGCVELGAEFVHGSAHEVRKLARDSKIQVTKQKAISTIVNNGTHYVESGFWGRMEKILKKLGSGKDSTLKQRFHRIKDPRDLRDLLAFAEGFYGADPTRLSVRSVTEAGVPRYNSFIPSGYQSLIDQLESSIPKKNIRFHSYVNKIMWAKDGAQIYVQGLKKPLLARKVIVTLPIGVLKSSQAPKWVPPLPHFKKNLSKIEMGNISKVTFEMSNHFWSHYRWAAEGLIHPESKDGVEVYWARRPFMVSWIGGPRAKELNKLSHSKILKFHRDAFKREFAMNSVSRFVLHEYSHNWQTDKLTLGAYSYLNVGGSRAIEELKKSVSDVIYFSGEAFAEESGTVEGAIETGKETARCIRSLLAND
jgi:monoamine oxidase